MFSRYAKDLFLFRDFMDEKNKSISLLNDYVLKSAHNKLMDYIFKFAGLISVLEGSSSPIRLCESGSSLYGFIDECIAMDMVYHGGENISDINKIEYIGSDISIMMNKGAQAFHPGNKFIFSLADTIRDLLNEIDPIDLFYGLSISLRYALREAEDLVNIGLKSRLAIFNRLSLSKNETKCKIAGTGKYTYIISLPDFVKLLHKHCIAAKYCTANMQMNKDGVETIRASIIMSKDERILEKFISHYQSYVDKSSAIKGVEKGVWRNIDDLLK